MKNIIIFSMLLLLLATKVKANMDCMWNSRYKNIELQLTGSCDSQTQHFLDSVLLSICNQVPIMDTNTKMLILINSALIEHFKDTSSFISLGFDTLRSIDNDFVLNFYSQPNVSTNLILDVNATDKSNASNIIGVKMIYNSFGRKVNWEQLAYLIKYAFSNVNVIKKEQKKIIVKYYANNWKLSLPTINVSEINKTAKQNQDFGQPKSNTNKTTTWYYIVGLIICLVIFSLVYRSTRKK